MEMLMSVGVGSLALLATGSTFLYHARTSAAIANYVDLDRQSQIALDHLSQQIRNVQRLTSFNSTNLTFQDFDGQTLQFNYDPVNQTFTRVKTNQSVLYLQNLSSMDFLIYQHLVQSGTFDAVSSAGVTNCKIVEINWACSRDVMGREYSTESLRSAKVVIRNH